MTAFIGAHLGAILLAWAAGVVFAWALCAAAREDDTPGPVQSPVSIDPQPTNAPAVTTQLPRAQVDALARRARCVDPRGVRVVEVMRRG